MRSLLRWLLVALMGGVIVLACDETPDNSGPPGGDGDSDSDSDSDSDAGSDSPTWRFSLEEVQESQRHGFADLPALLAFLRQITQAANESDEFHVPSFVEHDKESNDVKKSNGRNI